LVGQFLVGDLEAAPHERYCEALAALQQNASSFDLSGLFKNLGDHVEYASSGDRQTSYYPILQMLAHLSRSGLQALRERFIECLRAVKEDEFIRPLRFVAPELDCGFLLVPLRSAQFDDRIGALKTYSLTAKYDQKTTHQIGISFAARGDDLMIDWLYASSPWTQDPAIEAVLRDYYPFRPVRQKEVARYSFSTVQLKRSGLGKGASADGESPGCSEEPGDSQANGS
jgi:hypothetical protein